MAQLIISLKGKELDRQQVTKAPFLFGSGQHNDVVLENPAISNTHFRIEYKDYRFVLVDDQSTNGTFIGQQKIAEKVLEKGDQWMVGKFTFTVDDLHEAPTEIQTWGERAEMISTETLGTTKLSNTDLKQVMRAALGAQKASIPPIEQSAPAVQTTSYELQESNEQVTQGSVLFLFTLALILCLLAGIWLGRVM